MKLSEASVRIAEASQSELITTTSEIMLGRIWREHDASGPQP
jgi:hypothetical protein